MLKYTFRTVDIHLDGNTWITLVYIGGLLSFRKTRIRSL